MRDETAKDNRETAALITHLTRNNELAFSFSITEIFLSLFRLLYPQRIVINDILRKSDVKSLIT